VVCWLEAAYGLKQRGMNVTVLHLMDRIMERQLDGRASEMLRHSIEEKGIRSSLKPILKL
jgi:NAD(P)H-nitrite reductase large subunit